MAQNYIDINGTKYYTGSVFILNHMGKHAEATFVYCNSDHNYYFFKINGKDCGMSGEAFNANLVEITNKFNTNVRMPIRKRKNEFEIDGMLIGWAWYIFLMAISFIFKDAFILWILITVIFFAWRAKKIKKDGEYIEW